MNSNKEHKRGNSSVCNFNSQISRKCHCRIPEQFRRVRLQSNANMYQNTIHMDKAIKMLENESEDGKANVHFSHKVKEPINTGWCSPEAPLQMELQYWATAICAGTKMHFCPAHTFYQAHTEATGRKMCPTQVLLANQEAH